MMLGALAVATPALADDVAQREAQARFEEGLARVRNKDFEGALVAFQQANSVIKKPAVVWNLALTEEKTNRPVDALTHFREFLREAEAADPDRPRAQKHIDGLNAATGHIDVAAPAGATITLDGSRAVGAMPLTDPVDVVPGHHDVEARLQGAAKSVSLDVVAGQTARADLAALIAGPAPGATALQSTGEPPGAGTEPPPVPADQAAHGSGSTERLITVIGVGTAAVVAAGVGLGLGIQSTNAGGGASAIRNANPGLTCVGPNLSQTCQTLASDVSTEKNDHTASTVMWVVSGVLAAGAVGAFFLWPKPAASVTVTPAVGPSSAGLSAVGTF
jgi:hypothetical protein